MDTITNISGYPVTGYRRRDLSNNSHDATFTIAVGKVGAYRGEVEVKTFELFDEYELTVTGRVLSPQNNNVSWFTRRHHWQGDNYTQGTATGIISTHTDGNGADLARTIADVLDLCEVAAKQAEDVYMRKSEDKS